MLVYSTHHIIHCACDVLTNSTAYSHTRHHSCHIKTIAITADINISCTISTHLSKCICTSHTNLCLLFHLERTNISGLCSLVLCVLTFLTLNTERFLVMFSFDTLFCGNISNLRFGFCFDSSTSDIFGNAHKLTITFA